MTGKSGGRRRYRAVTMTLAEEPERRFRRKPHPRRPSSTGGTRGPAGWPVRCVMSEMTTTSTHTYTPVELCRAGDVHFCRMRNILPSREKVKLTRDESDSVEIPLGVSGAPFAPSPHVAPWALSSRFAFCLPQLLPACHAPPRAQRCARGGKCVARGGRSQPRRLTGHRLAGFHLERQNETACRSSCGKKST